MVLVVSSLDAAQVYHLTVRDYNVSHVSLSLIRFKINDHIPKAGTCVPQVISHLPQLLGQSPHLLSRRDFIEVRKQVLQRLIQGPALNSHNSISLSSAE